jgi:hypothetical protein
VGGKVSLVATSVAAAVLVTAALAAVAPPTGNKRAIAFFKREVAHYSPLPGAKVLETGYFFVAPSGSGSVRFWWGRPPPPGFVPATATILELLSNGRIVAYLAQLAAPKVRRVRVLMVGGSVFISSSKCWRKAPVTSSPLGTGETFLFNDGGTYFLPLVSGTESAAATFTYTWNPGAQARETDTFSRGATPTVSVAIEVSGAQRMHVEKEITLLSTAPVLPAPSPPALPAPKPLCSRR